jgi:hypothetical protein
MLAPEGTKCFVGDLPEQEQKVVWATHYAPGVDLLSLRSRNRAGSSWPRMYDGAGERAAWIVSMCTIVE